MPICSHADGRRRPRSPTGQVRGLQTLQSAPSGQAGRGDLAKISSLERASRMDALPIDGVSACALAFGTLLSSQGADAHLRKTLILLGGNPTNLPPVPGPVCSADRTVTPGVFLQHSPTADCCCMIQSAGHCRLVPRDPAAVSGPL